MHPDDNGFVLVLAARLREHLTKRFIAKATKTSNKVKQMDVAKKKQILLP